MWRVIISLSIFWGALAAGIIARQHGWLGERGSRRLIAVMIKGLEPVIIGLSYWQLDLSHPRVLFLPLVGCAIAGSSLPMAWLLGRRLRLAPAEMGTFLPSAFFAIIPPCPTGLSLLLIFFISWPPSFGWVAWFSWQSSATPACGARSA